MGYSFSKNLDSPKNKNYIFDISMKNGKNYDILLLNLKGLNGCELGYKQHFVGFLNKDFISSK